MFNVPVRFRFWDKLKLYSDFISKKSIFQEKHWDICQVILAWSASPKHKNIGSFLDTNKVCNIFGIGKDSCHNVFIATDKTKTAKIERLTRLADCDVRNDYIKIIESMPDENIDNSKLRKEIISHAINKAQIPNEFGSDFIKEIVSKTVKENMVNVKKAIENLITLGFCDYDEIRGIKINEKGFLMGELLLEISRSIILKTMYIFTDWIIKLFVILLFVYSFIYIYEYVFDHVLSYFY